MKNLKKWGGYIFLIYVASLFFYYIFSSDSGTTHPDVEANAPESVIDSPEISSTSSFLASLSFEPEPSVLYVFYGEDARCTNRDGTSIDLKQVCLSTHDAQLFCENASGFTVNVRSSVRFSNREYREWIRSGGDFKGGRVHWTNGRCDSSFRITGTFRGTQVNEAFDGPVAGFLLTDSAEVLVHRIQAR